MAQPGRTPSARPLLDALENRRLLAVFAPDVTFGDGGSAAVEGGDVQVWSDGAITLVSSRQFYDDPEDGGDFNHTEFYQTRLNPDGTRDTTYGVNGTKGHRHVLPSAASDRAILSFDDLGDPDEIIALQRNFTRTTRSPTTGGWRFRSKIPNRCGSTSFSAEASSWAPDGDLVVEYWQSLIDAQSHFTTAAHYQTEPDGSLETSFGNNGILTCRRTSRSCRSSSHGMVTRINTPQVHQLHRYTLDGEPDQSFGRNGVISLSSLVGQVRGAGQRQADPHVPAQGQRRHPAEAVPVERGRVARCVVRRQRQRFDLSRGWERRSWRSASSPTRKAGSGCRRRESCSDSA
jgi:hypothetical protein